MMRKLNRIHGLRVLLAASALTLLVVGCANLNEDPGNSSTMDADISGLQQQLGFSESYAADGTRIVSPPVSDAMEVVETLVVGAVVVNEQSTVYTQQSLTTEGQNRLETDVLNSANYFTVIDLPTTAETVEFNLPPEVAGDWQVMAAALRVNIDVLADIENQSDSITHYGFSDTFVDQDTALNGVSLVMRRACLGGDPPSGCGQIDAQGDPVLTGAVEIQDALIMRSGSTEYTSFAGALPAVSDSVTVLGDQISFSLDFDTILGTNSFPITVRSSDMLTLGSTAVETTVEWALETGLESLLASVSPTPSTGDTLTLVTTHEAAWDTGECTAFTYAELGTDAINAPETLSTAAQEWISECLQVYTTVLEEEVVFDFATPPVSSTF